MHKDADENILLFYYLTKSIELIKNRLQINYFIRFKENFRSFSSNLMRFELILK